MMGWRRLVVVGLSVVGVWGAAASPASAQPVCGQVITEDTTLESDLECDGIALLIGAPGVTLDLGGHKVDAGPGGPALRDQGYDDVTIRNGSVICDSGYCIELSNVSGGRIRDISVAGFMRAIAITDSDHVRVVRNNVGDERITLSRTDDSVVRDNAFIGGYEGGLRVDGSRNRIVDNVIRTSDSPAFVLGSADHTLVARNVLASAAAPSMSLINADDNRVVDNSMTSSVPEWRPGSGLWLTSSSRNEILRNDSVAGGIGVWLISGADNLIRRNNASDGVGPDGFLVEAAATGTVLQGNLATGWADDGIDVDAPGTALRRNAANDNGDLGIEAVPGIIDLGGNRAAGNGNPLQCLNVACR